MRRELDSAINALRLASPDVGVRLAAAKALSGEADGVALPAIKAALVEGSRSGHSRVADADEASIELASSDKATRLARVRALAESDHETKRRCCGRAGKKGDKFVEPDDGDARRGRNSRCASSRHGSRRGEIVGRVFTGISLG